VNREAFLQPSTPFNIVGGDALLQPRTPRQIVGGDAVLQPRTSRHFVGGDALLQTRTPRQIMGGDASSQSRAPREKISILKSNSKTTLKVSCIFSREESFTLPKKMNFFRIKAPLRIDQAFIASQMQSQSKVAVKIAPVALVKQWSTVVKQGILSKPTKLSLAANLKQIKSETGMSGEKLVNIDPKESKEKKEQNPIQKFMQMQKSHNIFDRPPQSFRTDEDYINDQVRNEKILSQLENDRWLKSPQQFKTSLLHTKSPFSVKNRYELFTNESSNVNSNEDFTEETNDFDSKAMALRKTKRVKKLHVVSKMTAINILP